MRLVHPIVDEWGDDFVVYATGVPTVLLTEPLVGFLELAALEGKRPVLVTPVYSHLSACVSLAMRRGGAYWVVQKVTGECYDGLSGYRIEQLADLWIPVAQPRPQLAAFAGSPVGLQRVIAFDVHAYHRAADSTVLGGVAEAVVRGLGVSGLDSWGVVEPLGELWDTAAITSWVKASMPESPVMYGSGPDGSFAAIQVSRTRTGLLEHTQGGVPVSEGAEQLADYVGLASGVLELVAEKFLPTIAFASLAHWDDGITQRVRARPPESPLAVLIGAKGVRDLGLDVTELAVTHDVSVLGRAKTPSVIVRFSDPTMGLWAQLMEFAGTLDPRRFAAATGIADVLDGGV